METRIIKEQIKREELQKMASEGFGGVVKATVDVRQGIMAVAGEFHAEQEELLINEHGSERKNTWGINLYPNEIGNDFIEFDSMVNLKPNHGNNIRGVEDKKVRDQITGIVNKLVA